MGEPDIPAAAKALMDEQFTHVEYVTEPANEVYLPHEHQETRLHFVDGDMQLKHGEDGDWQTLQPGESAIVQEGQVHEAKVGADGAHYWAIWDPEAAKKMGKPPRHYRSLRPLLESANLIEH